MRPILANSIVDSHFHVFPADQSVPNARYKPAYNATLEQWTEQASPLNIGRGVLVQPSFLGFDNSLLLQTLGKDSTNLRGVAVLPLHTSLARMEQLHALGIRGIRINCAGTNHQLASSSEQKHFFDALLALNWHVELHTDQGLLPSVISQLPEQLTLVIDHMGKPNSAQHNDETFHQVEKRNNLAPVFIKLSGAYRLNGLNPAHVSRYWLQSIGPTQLLWGSDWPCTNHESHANYAALFTSLSEWLGDEAFVQQALVNNPNRLYWQTT